MISIDFYKPSFFSKFLEAHLVMAEVSNNTLSSTGNAKTVRNFKSEHHFLVQLLSWSRVPAEFGSVCKIPGFLVVT
jgi:hypothetical protein